MGCGLICAQTALSLRTDVRLSVSKRGHDRSSLALSPGGLDFLWCSLRRCQQRVDPWTGILDFLILPGARPLSPTKTVADFILSILLSERNLPRGSRPDFIFIQPWLDAFLDQHLSDLADGWLVLIIVAQKHIKDFRFGVLSIHTEG